MWAWDICESVVYWIAHSLLEKISNHIEYVKGDLSLLVNIWNPIIFRIFWRDRLIIHPLFVSY